MTHDTNYETGPTTASEPGPTPGTEPEPAAKRRRWFMIPTQFPEVEVTEDDRTMAALAHGSIILSLLTGGLGGLIVAGVIWAVYRDKSPWVTYQALQALLFQVVALLGSIALGLIATVAIVISSLLTAILIGLCLLPFALLLGLVAAIFPLAAVAYGVYGALESYRGHDFRYLWIGDIVEGAVA